MMRKILTLILILTLVISSATTVAFADPWKDESGNYPPGLSKTGGLPPGIAKKFLDIDGYKWAEKAIEKMAEKGVIMGIGQGRFAPQSSVTKLEAIVMALRVMGEDDLAKEYLVDVKAGKKKLKFKDNLQEWAYGYVALAEEKGLLDDADILYFRLNDPATRHEVAKYLVRAMGDEDTAQDHMNADLDFIDASLIPQGSVGYIYVANKEKIITGYEDDTFRPFNAVTRAEMAVMVDRLDGTVEDDDEFYEIVRGEVTDIDDDWIAIDDDEKFDITNDTEVFFDDDEEGEIEDLAVGDEVKIKVNAEDEILSIEVDRDLYEVYEGEVTDIDDDWIEIDDDDKFDITNDTEVFFDDDEEGEIEDLAVGDEVKIKVNAEDEILSIEVDRDLYEVYEGEVTDIDDDWIEIDDDDKFDITNDTEVFFDDDEEGAIEDLLVGDEVKVKVNAEDEIISIEVDRELYEVYEGELTAISTDYRMINIEIDDDENKILSIADDVVVIIEGDDSEMEDLRFGDEVKVKINNDEEVIFIEVLDN